MIVSNKNILGGEPVIKGTRIPIKRLLYLVSQGHDLKQLHEVYPQLSMKQLKKVFEEAADLITKLS